MQRDITPFCAKKYLKIKTFPRFSKITRNIKKLRPNFLDYEKKKNQENQDWCL